MRSVLGSVELRELELAAVVARRAQPGPDLGAPVDALHLVTPGPAEVWGVVRTAWDRALHQRVTDEALGSAALAADLHLLEVGPVHGGPRPDLALARVDRVRAHARIGRIRRFARPVERHGTCGAGARRSR
ncbi:MAG: hypothetical protein ABMB14_06320 [Myxococcota bacterium]